MATVGKVTIANDQPLISSSLDPRQQRQCSPTLSTLLNNNICEACIEREWYLAERQSDDSCWYNKTQFHEYYRDQCDWYWQQAKKRPRLYPLARAREWKYPNDRKVTNAPTVEAEAVSAPIRRQCGRPEEGPVILMSKGCRHAIIDGCLHEGREEDIVEDIARALKLHGVSGKTDCLVCSQRPREMLLGCGHLLTCSACLDKFTNCEICEKPITLFCKISIPDSGYAHGLHKNASSGEANSFSEQSGSGLLSGSDAISEQSGSGLLSGSDAISEGTDCMQHLDL